MQYKRILRIFVTILTASAAAALFLPAGAAPSGTLASAVDKPAQWASISSYASKVQERLSKNPLFGGIEYSDAEGPTLIISWIGPSNDQLVDALSPRPEGVEITVRAARYSRIALENASRRLIDSAPPDRDWVGAWPSQDGQGVFLEVAGDGRDAKSAAQDIVSMDVTVVPNASSPMAASRQLDDSPFDGGAQIRNRANQEFCTSGFRFKTPTGGYRMLTAWHCNARESTNSYYNTHSADAGGPGITFGQQVGGGFARSDSSFLVAPSGSSYATAIYDGPYDGAAKSKVAGAESPTVGGYVCISGGFSGVICNNRILSTGLTTKVLNLDGEPFWIDHGFVTSQTGGVAAAGHGDSGGPVYVTASDGVNAVGMIDAIYAADFPAQCRGAYWITLECSTRVLSIGIRSIENASGYSVD